MRNTLAVLTTLSAALLLVGCATSPEQDPASTDESSADSATESTTDCDAPESGPTSDAVEVTGDFGESVDVDFDTPIIQQLTERSVVTEGDGDVALPNRTIKLAMAVYNGTSGEQVMSVGYDDDSPPLTYTVGDRQLIPGMAMLTECATVGSRLVLTSFAKDSLATDPSNFGFAHDDTAVFVGDILDVLPWRASGEPQPAPEGFPPVELADDGTPTVTIPDEDPPSETKIADLKLGDGDTVESGDTVTVHYQGVNWRTGEVFDQSWGKAPAEFPTTGVIKGFSDALVGQKVGSQVIAVIAPDDGYGPNGGQPAAGIRADDTLVFVIDILGTTSQDEQGADSKQ